MLGKSSVAFMDVFLNSLLIFIMLFTLSFIDQKKTQEYEKPAVEFLMNMIWPDKASSDIDIWLKTPDGETLWYGDNDRGLFIIDRDDKGSENACTYVVGRVPICDYTNREVLSIRTIMPGTYVLNIHMYSQKEGESIPVTVRFEKMNPTVSLIYETTITLSKHWQEEQVLTFQVHEDGTVTKIKGAPFEPLVDKKVLTSGVRLDDTDTGGGR
jgi:hypothetical protein